MIAAAETKRFDPEYFQKQHLADAALVESEPDRFQTFAEMGMKLPAACCGELHCHLPAQRRAREACPIDGKSEYAELADHLTSHTR